MKIQNSSDILYLLLYKGWWPYIRNMKMAKDKINLNFLTKISSFPNWFLIKSTNDLILAWSMTSSWWKTTRPGKESCFNFSTASRPLFSSLAVSTTVIPLEANCLHTANPIPLFAPVTTAYLEIRSTTWHYESLWLSLC